jgi:glycosyltransferase involved in cell wall biosynthesis
MKILVYCEPLLVPTSATPGRGMLKELIALRVQDEFILVVRSNWEKNPYLRSFFDELAMQKNWEIYKQKPSRKIINLLALFKIKSYCRITPKADVYLNMDCDYLGKNAHPLLITVADLSVLKGQDKSSYKNKVKFYLRKHILAKGIEKADHIIAISQSTKNDINKFFPFRNNADISVVYNGISPEWFNAALNPGSDNYFIWWGFISARKNIELLLQGYAKASKEFNLGVQFPDLKLVYSNTSVPEKIIKLTTDLGIVHKVSFISALSFKELIKMVSHSKGLLFPSLVEGFGVPVIEALSCGKPVLAADIPALREIGGKYVDYCNPCDIYSICEGIIRISSINNTTEIINKRRQYSGAFSYHKAAIDYSTLINKNSEL